MDQLAEDCQYHCTRNNYSSTSNNETVLENAEGGERQQRRNEGSNALLPYGPNCHITVHSSLLSSPSCLLSYILSLQSAVSDLQDQNKWLLQKNKRLRSHLRRYCLKTTPVSNPTIAEVIPLPPIRPVGHEPSIEENVSTTDDRNPTSFVSVLAPSCKTGSHNACPSQNVSSSNITPQTTQQNSLAILPPQALPEPCLNSSPESFVETIRSPETSEQTANRAVSSEDISVAVINQRINSTNSGHDLQLERSALSSLECSFNQRIPSAVSVTDMHNNTEGVETPSNAIRTRSTDVADSPEYRSKPSVYVTPSTGSGWNQIAPNHPSFPVLDSVSDQRGPNRANSHDQDITHPFIPFLHMTRRGFLQRLRRNKRTYHESDDMNSRAGLSNSWPSSEELSQSGCCTGTSDGLVIVSRRRGSCADCSDSREVVSGASIDEHRHDTSSPLTQLHFDAQLFEVHRRRLAAGRLSEEPEELGNDFEDDNSTSVTSLLPDDEFQLRIDHSDSADSLHVNFDSEELIANQLDLDEDEVAIGGDDLAIEETSSDSSTESADGRGDAVSEAPSSSSSDSEPEPTSSNNNLIPTATTVTSAQKCGVDLGGKYGNLGVLFRPRPASGHRYVISVNEVASRRRNETRLPSWVPTYAQRIECILHQFMNEMENSSESVQVGSDLSLVYVRLRGEPPMRILEFDESSDSEESCIRTINTSTKQKKSCLKLMSREGNIGECRPKNLSWSQHIYIAQIPSVRIPYADYDKNKTNSCPGIYYMGEFSIQSGGSEEATTSQIQRFGGPIRVLKIVTKVCQCLRCNSPPPQPVESTMDVRSGDGTAGDVVFQKESLTSFKPPEFRKARLRCPRFNFKQRKKTKPNFSRLNKNDTLRSGKASPS